MFDNRLRNKIKSTERNAKICFQSANFFREKTKNDQNSCASDYYYNFPIQHHKSSSFNAFFHRDRRNFVQFDYNFIF